MKNLLLLSFLVVVLFACKQNASEDSANKDMTENASALKYTLTPFAPSTEYADASLSSMMYSEGKFNFGVSGSTYQLGQQTPDANNKMCANSAEGQHIHLIVGDNPYAAKYTPEFEYPLTDGVNFVLAFLSRSYHESIKSPTAFIAQKMKITEGAFVGSRDIDEPMLFYSRPKGTYVGDDTKKVMLDFYLVNVAALGDTFKVEADINGEKHLIDKWQPYYIEGLPMGENSITLTLLDAENKAVVTPFNPVTRVFELKEELNPEK